MEDTTWGKFIDKEKEKPYMKNIQEFLTTKYEKGVDIYPTINLTFGAFMICPFETTKVVIIGQDPYHGPDQANGLAFAVGPYMLIPPSLSNILKVSKGDDRTLVTWAKQGVFLLNTVLSVERGKANSHKNIGWQNFTRKAIKKLNDEKSGLVFMLWGKCAQENVSLIDRNKHLILCATHPSPLSANQTWTKAGESFMECDHFNKANTYLEGLGKTPIKWSSS